MFNILLIFLQTICCIIIFITGVTWISDSLPIWNTSARKILELLGDALGTAAAFTLIFRSPDPYVVLLLLGVTIGLMTHHSFSWWCWLWNGFDNRWGEIENHDRRARR